MGVRLALALVALLALAPSAAACAGLSPGDQIVSDGASCTLAFLVAAKDGLYFMTAGHCVQVDATVENPDYGVIGKGALHHLEPETGSPQDGEPGEDFALIRIDPALYDDLNPKVCGWDGPTGIYDEVPGSGGVRHYGHGLVFGEGGPTTQQRTGTNLVNDDNFAFYWTGAGVPGDSGSAVLAEDGRALGVLTHLSISVGVGGGAQSNGGTHMFRGYDLANASGIGPLRLVLLGEDPVAVLAEVQGAPPPSATPGAPTPVSPSPATPKPTPANATRPTPTSPTPGGNLSPAGDDGTIPAATDDEARTPGPALALVLVAIALVAARRRR